MHFADESLPSAEMGQTSHALALISNFAALDQREAAPNRNPVRVRLEL